MKNVLNIMIENNENIARLMDFVEATSSTLRHTVQTSA